MQCRTASGHAFRAYFIRPDGTLKLVYEHRVLVSDDPDAEDTVSIQPCGASAKPFIRGGSAAQLPGPEETNPPTDSTEEECAESAAETAQAASGAADSSQEKQLPIASHDEPVVSPGGDGASSYTWVFVVALLLLGSVGIAYRQVGTLSKPVYPSDSCTQTLVHSNWIVPEGLHQGLRQFLRSIATQVSSLTSALTPVVLQGHERGRSLADEIAMLGELATPLKELAAAQNTGAFPNNR